MSLNSLKDDKCKNTGANLCHPIRNEDRIKAICYDQNNCSNDFPPFATITTLLITPSG